MYLNSTWRLDGFTDSLGIEDAIARYYEEDSSQLDPQRGLSQRGLYQPSAKKKQSNTEKLLKRELWHGQERGGGSTHMPPHSRQIRPRCAFVPSAPWNKSGDQHDVPTSSSPPKDTAQTYFRSPESQDIVLFVSETQGSHGPSPAP
jgi:hypothetical protein